MPKLSKLWDLDPVELTDAQLAQVELDEDEDEDEDEGGGDTEEEEPVHKVGGFAHILKANPYHDELGRFSTEGKANFVSIGGIFDKQREKATGGKGNSSSAKKVDFVAMGAKGSEDYKAFDKAHKEYLTSLPKNQLEAAYRYTGSYYDNINSALRSDTGDWGSSSKKTKLLETITDLDAAIAGSSVGRDLKVFRGIQSGYARTLKELHDKGKLVGSILEDKGYSSTTVDKDIADDWAAGGAVMHMNVPKSAKGVYVGGDKYGSKYSQHPSEQELLLGRRTKQVVTHAETDTNGLLRIHTNVIPDDPPPLKVNPPKQNTDGYSHLF